MGLLRAPKGIGKHSGSEPAGSGMSEIHAGVFEDHSIEQNRIPIGKVGDRTEETFDNMISEAEKGAREKARISAAEEELGDTAAAIVDLELGIRREGEKPSDRAMTTAKRILRDGGYNVPSAHEQPGTIAPRGIGKFGT